MSLFLKKKLYISMFISMFIGGFSLFAQDKPVGLIVDDSVLRTQVKESWFMESPERVLSRTGFLHNLAGGGRVQVRTEATDDEFMVILARELVNSSRRNAFSGHFPGWAQGSWILTRKKDTGEPSRIRVFLRSDPFTYIQFRPAGENSSQLDVVLYDAFIVRSLSVPVSMTRLYTMPLNDALSLLGNKFPRRYFEPNLADYRQQRLLVSKVQAELPKLNFADDGAIDHNDRYVYIKDGAEQTGEVGLNCSGFAKWLVDGLLRPSTGTNLAIPPLKEPFGDRGSSFTDVYEELHDTFFGLDWIRNLACQAWSVLRSPDFTKLNEIEVRSEPFSRLIIRQGRETSIQSYPGFLENAGYGVEGLLPLLYTLAIDDPGKIYLAAVNNEVGPPTTTENPRGRPRMRKYFHVAALIPYFNENGAFRVTVFESAAETSILSFRNRYPGHYVSLVRIPIE